MSWKKSALSIIDIKSIDWDIDWGNSPSIREYGKTKSWYSLNRTFFVGEIRPIDVVVHTAHTYVRSQRE